MANYVFKFVGSSEATTPYFGRMKPRDAIKMTDEKNKVKLGEVSFIPRQRLLFLGISPEWEPISKSAKDIQVLVDPDHLRCDLEIAPREHIELLHPGALADWDMMHKKKEGEE